MSAMGESSSEWESEGERPLRARGQGFRIRTKGKNRSKGRRVGKEGCAALRFGREEGEREVARRSRGGIRASREAEEVALQGGGHGLVGDEGWRLTMLRAAREGESSPPSSGPGDDEWLAARGSVNPTNGGCSGNGERASSAHRGSQEGAEADRDEEEALDAEFLGGWYSGGSAEDPQAPAYTWATTDASGLARIYWWMGGVTIMPPQRYWRGRAQARIVMAGRQSADLPREWRQPPESVAADIVRYLQEYRRHSGVVPRATTWQLLMRGTRDSRGDDIGASFRCELMRGTTTSRGLSRDPDRYGGARGARILRDGKGSPMWTSHATAGGLPAARGGRKDRGQGAAGHIATLFTAPGRRRRTGLLATGYPVLPNVGKVPATKEVQRGPIRDHAAILEARG